MTTPLPPNVDTDAAITTLLRECRSIAVVGLSPKAHRDSHHVALYLQQQGYRIVPVNPLATEILGERCWPSLTEAARYVQIDLVDVFRQSDEVPAIADEAIAIGARGLWLQLGVHHDAACEHARAAGLAVVQDKCTLVEHQRLNALDGAAQGRLAS